MRPLSKVTTGTLYWVKPQRTPEHFKLLDGDEVIGTLKRASFWNCRATAKITGNQWTIEHTVFQHWTVHDAESESDIAIYESSFWSNSGKLTRWVAQMPTRVNPGRRERIPPSTKPTNGTNIATSELNISVTGAANDGIHAEADASRTPATGSIQAMAAGRASSRS